jgi:hypothetical protein
MAQLEVKFPYGISNIEKLVEQNHVFVDKTKYIELLEQKESYVVFLRPRRIGKSLFVSILEYYYDILEKDKFEKVFSKLYIGQNPTRGVNAYRVLKMDFSGIDTQTEEATYKYFLETIKSTLNTFIGRYNILEPSIIENILSAGSPGSVMKKFFEGLKLWKEKTGDNLPIYIIIDEYDHFTNEILIRDLSEFKRSVSHDGYIRKFYEAIKIATQQGFVDRFFITGVSPVTMDGLTSGFNIVTHLSASKQFHNMIGFTEEEVTELLNLVLIDKSREEAIKTDLRNWYNGYCFNNEAENKLYNSDMVLYFLKSFSYEQRYPKLMLDPNIMPDYGKLKKLFQVADFNKNIMVLDEILKNNYISTELIYQFSFDKPFDRIAFVNLLYYLGNLTLNGETKYGMPNFVIPNYVIKELYWQYYAYLLQEKADLIDDAYEVRKVMYDTADGSIGPLLLLVQKLLESLSNRDFQKFDEKYVKMAIQAYAFQAKYYYVRSEREITNDGYIDLELLKHPDINAEPHEYVLEVKYLKQADEDQLNNCIDAAKKQLLSYIDKDNFLQSLPKLKAIVIVAVKDKLYWEEINYKQI